MHCVDDRPEEGGSYMQAITKYISVDLARSYFNKALKTHVNQPLSPKSSESLMASNEWIWEIFVTL